MPLKGEERIQGWKFDWRSLVLGFKTVEPVNSPEFTSKHVPVGKKVRNMVPICETVGYIKSLNIMNSYKM